MATPKETIWEIDPHTIAKHKILEGFHEPLIVPVRKLKLKNIHWVIVGGESGPKARPMKPEWVLAPKESIRNTKDQCKEDNVPFFFSQRDGKPKQWGGVNLPTYSQYLNRQAGNKKAGRILEGRMWELPVLRAG